MIITKISAIAAIIFSATASPIPPVAISSGTNQELVDRGYGSSSSSSSNSGSSSSSSLSSLGSSGSSGSSGAVAGSALTGSSGAVTGSGSSSNYVPSLPIIPPSYAINSSPSDGSPPVTNPFPGAGFFSCRTFPCSGPEKDTMCHAQGCGACSINGTCTAPLELTPLAPKPLAAMI